MGFRCILFLDASEFDIFAESRCICNVWFLEYTSEMLPFRAFPMYYYTGFSRRYIGIENPMPIPMYALQNSGRTYIGMGQYRLFPMYRQISPKQNTSEFNTFFQSRCILINFTRLYLPSLAGYPRVAHFTQPTPTQVRAKADIILLRAGNRPYKEYRHVCRARLSRRYCRCRYFWQD